MQTKIVLIRRIVMHEMPSVIVKLWRFVFFICFRLLIRAHGISLSWRMIISDWDIFVVVHVVASFHIGSFLLLPSLVTEKANALRIGSSFDDFFDNVAIPRFTFLYDLAAPQTNP